MTLLSTQANKGESEKMKNSITTPVDGLLEYVLRTIGKEENTLLNYTTRTYAHTHTRHETNE